MNREHGTMRGYKQHLRSDRQPCQPCRDANAARRRAYNARKRRRPSGLGWPR